VLLRKAGTRQKPKKPEERPWFGSVEQFEEVARVENIPEPIVDNTSDGFEDAPEEIQEANTNQVMDDIPSE